MGRGGLLRIVAACALLAACGSAAAPTPSTPSPDPTTSPPAYDAAAASDVYLPSTADRSRPVPVVVTLPGGTWRTADRRYIAPLAEQLATYGDVVVDATYRSGDVGALFPVPVQDVLCAAGHAVAAARRAGYTPGPVVLVGHSAGGHLAALAAVSGDALRAPCGDPVPHIDGVVGLAGIYDTAAAASLIGPFFGVPRDQQPALWDSGDPIHYVEAGAAPKPLSVLLLQGSADEVVPVSQPQEFARALRAHGYPVELDVLPGVTHRSLVAPDVSAGRIALFVRRLASTYAAAPTPSS